LDIQVMSCLDQIEDERNKNKHSEKGNCLNLDKIKIEEKWLPHLYLIWLNVRIKNKLSEYCN